MRNRQPAQWHVTDVTTTIPEARRVLGARQINPAANLTLAAAAAATSTHMDDLTAVLQYRLRRRAQAHQPAAPIELEAQV